MYNTLKQLIEQYITSGIPILVIVMNIVIFICRKN